jgi:hypothetical protein
MRFLVLLFLASAPALMAGPCVIDTLNNYEALGATGCQVGGLTIKDFTYTFVSGDVTVADTSITVTPTLGLGLDLKFSSTGWNISTSGHSSKYVLAYTWDPGDIRSLEDVMNTSTPVFPGFAQITTDMCLDAAFTPGPTCSTSTASMLVSHNGITANTTAITNFSPTIGTLGVRNTILLDTTGGPGASSQFDSLENTLFVPEPSTLVSGLAALALMLGGLRAKRL